MAIDYIVSLECEPKRHFGGGDAVRGQLEILERLKSRNRAQAVREMIRQKGLPDTNPTISVQTLDPQGNTVQKKISVAELEAHAQELDAQAAACANCPANFLNQPYGCNGAINYPVPQEGEAWLMSRVQPPGSTGAKLCAEFMDQFNVTGGAIRELRGGGFYELTKATSVPLVKGLFKSKSLSADQLLETLLMVGEMLEPGHCFGILIWLGAIRVDGQVPSSPEDRAVIETLLSLTTVEEKTEHTALEVGPKAESFQNLVIALYLCWVYDVPLYISS
jgi:hypothetical protein